MDYFQRVTIAIRKQIYNTFKVLEQSQISVTDKRSFLYNSSIGNSKKEG